MPSIIREIQVTPIDHRTKSDANFGATVHGIDLNNLTDSDFEVIHEALHKHMFLVFKEQPVMLTSQKQYARTRRFDPKETTDGFTHSTGPCLTSYNGLDIYGTPTRPAPPCQPTSCLRS